MSFPINFDRYVWTQLTLSPTAVASSTTSTQTFTVNGLLATDLIVEIDRNNLQTGLFITNAAVSAANTLQLQFANITSASITPTANGTYNACFCRPEKTLGGPDALSGNVVFP
jgi:hypothetical protein